MTIDEFVQALREVVRARGDTKRIIDAEGGLRFIREGEKNEDCPLTLVARERTGRASSLSSWLEAEELLGISREAAGIIIDTADREGGFYNPKLRKRLLAASRGK